MVRSILTILAWVLASMNDSGKQPRCRARISAGDQVAEMELVVMFKDWLTFILTRKFWGESFIEGVLRETFAETIIALRKGHLHDQNGLQQFMHDAAYSLADEYLSTDSVHNPRIDLDSISALVDTSASLYSHLRDDPLHACVQQVTKEMPDEINRQLLILFYCKGEDKMNICKQLAVTPAHFDDVLCTARQRLKTLLNEP